MKRHNLAPIAILVVLIGLVACGGEKREGNWITGTTDTTGTATGTHPASPGGTALVPETTAGTTVQIILEDGRIVPPTTPIPPGPVVVTASNGGTSAHNLHIEGPGVSRAADQDLAPGTTQSISVTLQQGTYTIYCPLADHRERGESITLTTGTDPATSTAVPTGTTDTAATTGT